MINVYLICAEIEGKKLYKIGYTRRTIEKRISEFRTGNASEFYIIDSFQSKWGTQIEARLHRTFRGKKVNGEWFDLTKEDLECFNRSCQIIHDGLNIIEKSNTYYIDRGSRF